MVNSQTPEREGLSFRFFFTLKSGYLFFDFPTEILPALMSDFDLSSGPRLQVAVVFC